MADILFPVAGVQLTAAPATFYDLLFTNNEIQNTSSACIVDLTPPVFAGVTFLDIESRGQIRVDWAAGTDVTLPIRYEVYIQASTATGLFNTANIVAITPHLQFDVYALPNGDLLSNGTTYYIGVRALDGVGNRDSNTVSLSVISTGILTSIDVYECKASWSSDDNNDFRITLWANKNGSLAVAPEAVLGTASYTVYDRAGIAIVGLTATGLTANAQGLYIAPAATGAIEPHRNHYSIKVTISVDGEVRTNFVPVTASATDYTINGTSDLDDSNNLVGSFWVLESGEVQTVSLGTGSYQAYTADGTLIPGLAETGITADVNGFFTITPFPLPPTIDGTKTFVIRLEATADGEIVSTNIILNGDPAVYTCKAAFSINAANMLEASFWATKNDIIADAALLGTASYAVYDKTGAAVAGLSGTGITADVNGLFHTTPVSAVLLSDLTHYVALITINVVGLDITAAKGFTLLGN